MKFAKQVLLLLLLEQVVNEEQRSLFRRMLTVEGHHRRDRRIHRCSLVDPNESPFRVLFESNSDPDLITFCGLDHAAFNELNNIFKPIYDSYTPVSRPCDGVFHRLPTHQVDEARRGRPRLLDSVGGLGLTLAWTRSRGSVALLDMCFGITDSDTSTWLEFGQVCLLRALRNDPRARVSLPESSGQIQELFDAIHEAHPHLISVYASLDGLKTVIEHTRSWRKQRAFCNKYGQVTLVSSCFVFLPDGTIGAYAVGGPGILSDSDLAWYGKIYDKLQRVYHQFRGRAVADSAFRVDHTLPYIIRCGENLDLEGVDIIVNEEAISLRQSSEWGMRGLQGAFPRLKDPLQYEEYGRRHEILEMLALLFNFRTRLVGLNHIRSTYMPCYDADIDGLSFIAKRRGVPDQLRDAVLARNLNLPFFSGAENSDDSSTADIDMSDAEN